MKRHKAAKTALSIGKYILVALLFLWIVLPIAWMFISSISENKDLLNADSGFWPSEVSFRRYEEIFFSQPSGGIQTPAQVFKTAIKNSLIISVSTTIVSLITGMLGSYAFSRLKFRGKGGLLMSFLVAQMLPAISLVIPMFFILKKFGLSDTKIGLVLVYISFVLPYVIWVLTNYFNTISKDLEAAAQIDGCTRLGAFFRIIVPTAGPGFVAVGVLSFLMSWDEFLYALILINSQGNKTIPVAISEFNGQFGLDYGMMMAGGFVATILPLALAMVFQRWIAMGMTAGAVKE